jgi:ABC-type lipoprotein release transport system permease subunit
MSVFVLIYKEIRHRKTNFLLSLLAVVVAVALSISFFTTGKASQRETARLMLSMGYNLRIIPKGTDKTKFLLTGLTDRTMPEDYLEKLALPKGFSYNHLLGSLQRKISWRGLEVVLTGLAEEKCPPGRKKPRMVKPIAPGTAYVGYMLAKELGLKEGDIIEIESRTLQIVKCLFEQGGVDDIRIQCNLQDAQQILNLPGQISEIQAVDCLCFALTPDPVSVLREEIASIVPQAEAFQIRPIANARTAQRRMIRNIFAVIMPIVVIACGVWIGVLAIMNVRDRKQEIGIMRALGYGSGKISSLFLGKAVLTGVLGAIVGFFVGTVLALSFGPFMFKITAKAIEPEYVWLVWSLVAAPVFTAVSSNIATMSAVAYDPAVTLRVE